MDCLYIQLDIFTFINIIYLIYLIILYHVFIKKNSPFSICLPCYMHTFLKTIRVFTVNSISKLDSYEDSFICIYDRNGNVYNIY